MSTEPADGGLFLDVARTLNRRRALRLAAATGTAFSLGGCNFFGLLGNAEANRSGTAADGSTCLKTPPETNGPYPADGSNTKGGTTLNVLRDAGLVRQDIRPSFAGLTPVADGVPLQLQIRLIDIANACKPLANHLIYIWHCDTKGRYSLYDDPDRNYLRGAGTTDAQGFVNFTTSFPGCYNGRWPHIHFEVFASQGPQLTVDDSLLVSQFIMPEETSRSLYTAAKEYGASLSNLARTSIASDFEFGDNTAEQNTAMTPVVSGDPSAGYMGSVTIGLATG